MNHSSTPSHNPFQVSNPIATDPAALKRQIDELQRRIDALGVEPKDG